MNNPKELPGSSHFPSALDRITHAHRGIDTQPRRTISQFFFSSFLRRWETTVVGRRIKVTLYGDAATCRVGGYGGVAGGDELRGCG